MPKALTDSSSTGGRGARGRRTSTALAEINVVPLVDVMLVLLIIFMVTAPMLQRSIEVNLPVASRTETVADERLFLDVPISFRKDRTVFIEREPIRIAVLGERLRQMMETRTDREVFIRSDGQLQVQQLVDVFDTLKAAGITTAGLVTDTPRAR